MFNEIQPTPVKNFYNKTWLNRVFPSKICEKSVKGFMSYDRTKNGQTNRDFYFLFKDIFADIVTFNVGLDNDLDNNNDFEEKKKK